MKKGNTAAAIESRRLKCTEMVQRVESTLRVMLRDNVDVTMASVARRAEVSRTFLYQNADARALVARYLSAGEESQKLVRQQRRDSETFAWRERALNAEHALAEANGEVLRQRRTIGEQLGKLRDLESDLPEDSAQRLMAQNLALRKEVRELSENMKLLRERLEGARDNNRYLENRLAELEAQLDPGPSLVVNAQAANKKAGVRSRRAPGAP